MAVFQGLLGLVLKILSILRYEEGKNQRGNYTLRGRSRNKEEFRAAFSLLIVFDGDLRRTLIHQALYHEPTEFNCRATISHSMQSILDFSIVETIFWALKFL